jgi:hypothetical protein
MLEINLAVEGLSKEKVEELTCIFVNILSACGATDISGGVYPEVEDGEEVGEVEKG